LKKALNCLGKGLTFFLVFTVLFSNCIMKKNIKEVMAASLDQSGRTTIYPNKLTIQWEDGDSIVIDSFRFFGHNVAQLRTMVSALKGTVIQLNDDTYQIVDSEIGAASFADISFSLQTEIDYIINKTPITPI